MTYNMTWVVDEKNPTIYMACGRLFYYCFDAIWSTEGEKTIFQPIKGSECEIASVNDYMRIKNVIHIH